MRGVLLLLFCLLIAVHGQKLSEAENLARFQSCGKYSNETAKDVPWVTWTQNYQYRNEGGFAISSRHIVTTSRLFYRRDIVDWSTCKNGVMPISADDLRWYFYKSCGPTGFCEPDTTKSKISKGVLIGTCDGKNKPVGLVVLEVDKDLGENEIGKPVCLDEDVTAEIGDKLEQHSYIWNEMVGRQENIVEDCGERELSPELLDSAVCTRKFRCSYYTGEPFVKNIGGRMTAVAVSHDLGCAENDTILIQLSIKKFLPAICEFTGVCQPPPPTTIPPPTTTPSPPPPPITDKINEENDQKTEEQTDENTGSASSENSSIGTQILELFGVLALFCYLY